MQISIFNRQKAVKISKVKIKKIIAKTIAYEGQTCDEVAVHFVTTKEICDLHQKFFNDPSTTDCISLPVDDPSETHYRILGDVFVCPETAIHYAHLNKCDVDCEITLYVVHGLLHLMGYDDIKAKDRALMRAAEKRHMDHLSQ